jgi:hypothetical protein
MIGGDTSADIRSLTEGGYEMLYCNFDFRQGIDWFGKATTRVHSGTLQTKLSQLPRKNLMEWALDSRKYSDRVIVLLDAENVPVGKIIFKNATCIDFGVDYTLKGESYTCTQVVVQAEKIIVSDDIECENK